jgi:hypothetical protein
LQAVLQSFFIAMFQQTDFGSIGEPAENSAIEFEDEFLIMTPGSDRSAKFQFVR